LRPDESATGPPRLPFVLSVGVTGHRLDTLSVEAISALSGRVSSALKLISETALQIHKRGADLFADDAPRFDFVSPLADGADQMAAEAALGLGYRLHAILPFPRADYREDLIGEEAKARFDTLLARSESCLELPGERSDELEAYVMTGRATVAHADMLIAVWDGLKARGRGGTAEVVEMAVAGGVRPGRRYVRRRSDVRAASGPGPCRANARGTDASAPRQAGGTLCRALLR